MAGIPNFNSTVLSKFLPTIDSLKILFEKWTIPVREIAISGGKKMSMTGVNIVPNPKPEKNVNKAAKKVTRDMIKMYIIAVFMK